MFRLALRSIVAHKVRFILPTLAVVLGVAFVVGSLLYSASVQSAVDRATMKAQKDVAVEVTPHRIDFPLGQDLVDKLAAVPGVAAVRPIANGYAFVVAKDGSLVGPPVSAGGVNFDPSRHSLINGRPPAAGEVAIDEWTAQRTGYHVGDRLRVVAGGTAYTVQLVGVFTAEDARLASGGTLTAFDVATARKLFAPTPDSYTAIDLTAAPGTSDSTLAQSVTAVLPKEAMAETRAELNATPGDNKLATILVGFATVALFVAIFLVANTFTMLAAARSREHALLRAVGADRRYVLRMVLAEAVLIGLVATVLGYLVGIGAAAILAKLFAATGGPPVPLQVISTGPMLAALGVGVGVTVLAAYVPARRAAKVPPIAALRSGLSPTVKSLRRRNIIGFGVTAIGGALTLAGIKTQDLIYLGGPLLVLGLIILTPLFGMWLTALLRRPLTRIAGIRGTLAIENTRRNPRRTASTASALMIGLAICAAVTVPIASVSAEAEEKADKADISVTAIDFAELSPDTAGVLAKLPDVREVKPEGSGRYKILVNVAPGRAEAVQKEIRDALDNPTVLVRTHAEYVAAANAEFDLFLNILYALLSVSVLIGALAVINTSTMSTWERIREIGLLRAVGLGRRQVGTILRLESVITAVLAAILGLGVGCLLGAVVVASQGSIAVVMPWGRLGLFVLLTAAIGVLAALWPARQAGRIPILAAISSDTD